MTTTGFDPTKLRRLYFHARIAYPIKLHGFAVIQKQNIACTVTLDIPRKRIASIYTIS
jgi:hypothetical protein